MDRDSKTFIGILCLIAAIFLGANYMVTENRDASVLTWAVIFLALAIFFWLWIRRDDRRPEEKAADTLETAESRMDKLTSSVREQVTEAKAVTAETAQTVETSAEAVKEEIETAVEEAPEEAEEMTAEAEAATASEAAEAPPEPEAVVVEEVVVVETAEPEPAPAPEPAGEPDDLTRVEGIGPKYRDALVDAGIDTFAKLAELNEERIVEIAKEAGMRRSASMETWVEQAKLAAAGDWDSLAALQERLSGGRRD